MDNLPPLKTRPTLQSIKIWRWFVFFQDDSWALNHFLGCDRLWCAITILGLVCIFILLLFVWNHIILLKNQQDARKRPITKKQKPKLGFVNRNPNQLSFFTPIRNLKNVISTISSKKDFLGKVVPKRMDFRKIHNHQKNYHHHYIKSLVLPSHRSSGIGPTNYQKNGNWIKNMHIPPNRDTPPQVTNLPIACKKVFNHLYKMRTNKTHNRLHINILIRQSLSWEYYTTTFSKEENSTW